MNTAVLTFPGHFFQTALCLRSVLTHYPETQGPITVIADDVECAAWPSYLADLETYLGTNHSIHIMPVSSLPGIRDCVAGWWRQQLIKLTLDEILPGDQWFVIDGDVIFGSRCEVLDRVPVSRWTDSSRWSIMCESYVKGVLGTDQGTLLDQGRPVATSPVPFRYLDRALLQDLRAHVRSLHQGDFLDLHLAWFADQTIVADWDPPHRWVMSEWELIECFRRRVQGRELPLLHIGSGYQVDTVPDAAQDCFIHSYQRDAAMGIRWFQDQALEIPQHLWQRAETWYRATK